MNLRVHNTVSLTALVGTPMTDPSGHLRGKLKDVAVATGTEAGKVAGLVLKTREGLRVVVATHVRETPSGALELLEDAILSPLHGDENFLLLGQDLIDRQIVDIHGRKVVRVNDVDMEWIGAESMRHLRVVSVETGLRGAIRRIFKGLVPKATLETLAGRVKASGIPWEFVDVIEVDPARRVKLRIGHDRLAKMHPSDLAEILEDLAPAEREAIFQTLDEEVAAEALEGADPKLQKSLIASLNSERLADIVEEMDPGAAADLLSELPDARSEEILEEMDPEERHEVEELLEFHEDSAAGRMTTDFVSVPETATVADAVEQLRGFDGDPESVTEIYLVGESRELKGVVSLSRLVLALPETRLAVLAEPQFVSCRSNEHQKEVAELFDKYNLHALPVVNSVGKLVGVVLAEHVIAYLRDQ